MVPQGLDMARRQWCAIVAVAAFAAIAVAPTGARAEEPTGARAEDAPAPQKPPVSRPTRTPLAVGAAIAPGLLVHGSGHFVGGDPRTGSRLLQMEAAGLGTMAVGFVPIVATGAARKLVGTGITLTVAGSGLFAISMLADLYGVLAPPGGVGAPSGVAPSLETEVGYRYVYNPVFSYRDFVHYAVDVRSGSWRVHPSAFLAVDQSASRLRLPIAFRLAGPRPKGPAARDGSYLDVETAFTRHAVFVDRFSTLTAELSISGRLDMQRVAASLEGSFAEAGFGLALQNYRYDVKGAASDIGELLLARFGYGMYVGWPGKPRGEVMVYYDHRHDDFAAGLKIPGIPSGVAGHFGVQARAYVTSELGFAAEAAAGSAYLVGASVLVRLGDRL